MFCSVRKRNVKPFKVAHLRICVFVCVFTGNTCQGYGHLIQKRQKINENGKKEVVCVRLGDR